MIQNLGKAFIVVWCLVGAGLSAASIFSGITTTGLSTEAAEAIVDPPSNGLTVTADILPTRTTCVAPCGIHFDGRGVTSSIQTDRWLGLADRLTVHYDFGDPGSGNWTRGPRAGSSIPHPKNEEIHFNAAHVYENPGTYTVTQTVWDAVENDTATATVSITVLDPDVFYAGSRTWCVAPNSTPVPGSDGCPSGAQVINLTADHSSIDVTDAFAETGLTAFADPGPQRVLLRRDRAYDHNTLSILKNDDNQIGAYGSGADPVITHRNGPAYRFDEINSSSDTDGWTLYGLDYQGDGPTLSAELFGVSPGQFVRNLTLWDVDGTGLWGHYFSQGSDVTQVANLGADEFSTDSNYGIIFYEVDITGMRSSLGHNNIFGMFTRSAFLGGSILDNEDNEHIMRSEWLTGSLFAHIDMGGDHNGVRLNIKIHSPQSVGNENLCNREFAYIDSNIIDSENTPTATAVTLGAFSSGPTNSNDDNTCVTNSIWDRNSFIAKDDGSLYRGVELHNFGNRFRNNIANISNGDNSAKFIFQIEMEAQTPQWFNERNEVSFNSVFANDNNNDDIFSILDDTSDDNIIQSNIGYFPVDSPREFAIDYTNDPSNTVENNTQFNTDPFAGLDSAMDTPEAFAPIGPALTNVQDEGPAIDFFGRCRPAVGKTRGAIEADSKVRPCPWEEGGSASLSTPSETLANATSPIGMNSAPIIHDDSHYRFADMAKQASHWFETTSGTCGDSPAIYTGPVNSQGIPTDLTGRVCVFFELYNRDWNTARWPLGQYEFETNGGTWNVVGSHDGWTQTGNSTLFTVNDDPATNHALRFELTGSTPTDVHIWTPGGMCSANATAPHAPDKFSYCESNADCGGSAPECATFKELSASNETYWRGDFLALLTEYRSYRFMEAQGGKGLLIDAFSEITQADQFSWTIQSRNPANGDQRSMIPLEPMAELCDLLGECSITVPPRFPAAESALLANWFRDNTAPSTVIVPSWGNEVWNGTFAVQFLDGVTLCNSLSPTDFDSTNCNAGADFTDRFSCNLSCTGYRTVEMADLWEASFSATGEEGRLSVVMAGQAGGTAGGTSFANSQLMSCPRWLTSPGGLGCIQATTNIDEFAIAAYPGTISSCTGTNTDAAIFAVEAADITDHFCNDHGAECYFPNLEDALVVRGSSIPMRAYEAGPHSADFGKEDCRRYNNTVGSGVGLSTSNLLSALHQIDNLRSIELFDEVTEDVVDAASFGFRNNMVEAHPKESAALEFIRAPGNECDWPSC